MHFKHIMESSSEQDQAKYCAGFCPNCLGICNCQVVQPAPHAGPSCAAAHPDRDPAKDSAEHRFSILTLSCFEHAASEPHHCAAHGQCPSLPFKALTSSLRLLLLQKHLRTERDYAPPHFSDEQMAEYSRYLATSLAPHLSALLQEEADEVRHEPLRSQSCVKELQAQRELGVNDKRGQAIAHCSPVLLALAWHAGRMTATPVRLRLQAAHEASDLPTLEHLFVPDERLLCDR